MGWGRQSASSNESRFQLYPHPAGIFGLDERDRKGLVIAGSNLMQIVAISGGPTQYRQDGALGSTH